MNQEYWEKIRLVRDSVNKEIERLRNQGELGSALEADVKLYCQPELKKQLDALGNELRFVLITSGAEVILAEPNEKSGVETDFPELRVKISPITLTKCERCWHRVPDVGINTSHPTLCTRCVENVSGRGEIRHFA